MFLILAFVADLAISAFAKSAGPRPIEEGTRNISTPNLILIMTDDQDLHMDSLKYMSAVQTHFGNEGTFYERHYCTVSKCCPSRVSLLTGKAAHNTNVTAVAAPYGAVPKQTSNGLKSY